MLGAKAPGANPHPLTLTVHHQGHWMYIGLKLPGCVPLGVAYVASESRYLVAYVTLGQNLILSLRVSSLEELGPSR